MAFRIYIVPVIGTGALDDGRRPKYFADGTWTPPSEWTGIDYGQEPTFFVGADLPADRETFLEGQSDVYAIPANMDTTVPGALVGAVQGKLEAINIPGGWLNAQMTWRETIRVVLGMAFYFQRFAYFNNGVPLFTGGVGLNTRWNQLSGAIQTTMLATADSFPLDSAFITDMTQIRAIEKTYSDQLQYIPVYFNTVQI
jgi:hypothetical protein